MGAPRRLQSRALISSLQLLFAPWVPRAALAEPCADQQPPAAPSPLGPHAASVAPRALQQPLAAPRPLGATRRPCRAARRAAASSCFAPRAASVGRAPFSSIQLLCVFGLTYRTARPPLVHSSLRLPLSNGSARHRRRRSCCRGCTRRRFPGPLGAARRPCRSARTSAASSCSAPLGRHAPPMQRRAPFSGLQLLHGPWALRATSVEPRAL